MIKTPEQQIAELKQSLAQAKQKKTLRDEFAMAALTGMLSNKKFMAYYMEPDAPKELAAFIAYNHADYMLKEREQ